MKSKEERKAAQAERVAAMNVKMDARKDAIRAKADARVAKIDAWANKGQPAVASAPTAEAPTRAPHRGPTLAGLLFPPLGAYQVVRSTVDQVKELNAMSPEERLEFTRRNPGFGSGGG